MRSLRHFSFSIAKQERGWKRYGSDTLVATVGALLVTFIIYLFQLYPKIPNISLMYLLVVLGVATIRGRYAAICASVIAFLSFDFFLVPPLYQFTIAKFDEWLALFVFLLTAIITGQLASALSRRAEEADEREHETRALYELVSATTNEEQLERQLAIVARAIVGIFASGGIRDCAILLPDEHGKLSLQADAQQELQEVKLSPDEQTTAALAMKQGTVIDIHRSIAVRAAGGRGIQRVRRIVSEVTDKSASKNSYIRMIPLKIGQRGLGVMRLLMDDDSPYFVDRQGTENNGSIGNTGSNKSPLDQRTTFFWTFLDQATSIIERARLHRESLQVELLQRTDALRAALLSSVSHDLRTPLASIKASASSLLQEDVQWNEEEQQSFALAIEREADRLNHLVGNLLDMSRIEGGALKPEKEWYPVDELIHDVLGHMQQLLQGRTLQVTIADELPPVELDYLQIDQVLTNLLENAARYTPLESPIEIEARVMDGSLLISIADRGPGIPSTDMERIFDKFYRVLGVQRKGTIGSGLGLSVCRGLVEAHGGHIWAENREGGGAIFRFTLPIEKTEEENNE